MGEGVAREGDARADLIGRAAELEAVDQFVQRAVSGPAGLLVDGDPGIGKTSVWREARRRAQAAGARILSAVPTEPERSLTLGGLTDLLAGVDDAELATLPLPQRHALGIALLRVEPSGQLPDQRTLSVATASLLRQLAADRPVVVAIDDVQWLDDASTAILAYGLRRVDHPFGVLLAARGAAGDRSADLLGAVPAERGDTVRLGPLPLAALHQLFLARFGRSFPRFELVRIESASGGNPFYALEIARSIIAGGPGAQSGGDIPIPERLAALLDARLGSLPSATREALLLVALAAEPTIDTLRRADPAALDALDAAFDTGVATVDPRVVRFSHPLLGEAVIRGASADARQRAHAALASAAASGEARARHLAGATQGRDEAVASALEAAAAVARDRGATLDAAAMYEQAAALTPEADPERVTDRARLAAETLFVDVSDYVQADRILAEAIDAAEPGPARAQALSLRALIRYYHGQTPEAIRLGDQAMDEAGTDPILRALVMGRAAFLVMQLDLERGNAIVTEALRLLDDAGGDRQVEPDIRANLLMLHASSELGLIRGYPAHEVEEARSLVSASGRSWEHDGVGGIDYGIARMRDEIDRAIAMTHELIAAKAGPGGDDPFNLVQLSGLQVLQGDLDAAEATAHAAVDGYAHEGADVFPAWRLRGVALVGAYRGRLDEARRLAGEGLALAVAAGDAVLEVFHRAILGFVALSASEPAEAFEQLDRAVTAARGAGTLHPGRFKLEADLAEAAVALGDIAAADMAVAWLERAASAAPTPWTSVTAARCRGLVQAATGDLDAATASLERALDAASTLPYPFERARTLLLAGILHRRRREKRLADERLREALAIFESVGNAAWADRASAELARVGRRPRAPGELTETEQRIAELAAEGMSARQIAERAFVAPKTVGNVLGRVYAKLGISSRAELGARMAERNRDRSG